MERKGPQTLDQLSSFIAQNRPALYVGSQSSTVIDFDHLDSNPLFKDTTLVSLGNLPSHLQIDKATQTAHIQGPITWRELRSACESQGLTIMTSPTEEEAQVLAGLATSATGERSFRFGTLREQIVQLEYMDYKGEIHTLKAQDPFTAQSPHLQAYQDFYQQNYADFKNAPTPRFLQATDLMIGSEGQLGIIISAQIKLTPLRPCTYLFAQLPHWKYEYNIHTQFHEKIQKFRTKIDLVEFADFNSLKHLNDDQFVSGKDALFLQMDEGYFEEFYEEFILQNDFIADEEYYQLSQARFHAIRAGIPRAINERNARLGVIKKGTDIQLRRNQISDLFNLYHKHEIKGIEFNLFGHFGDVHLHYNYLPKAHEQEKVQAELDKIYHEVLQLKGSPFAEHGIGTIKQSFIRPYLNTVQVSLLKDLKQEHDPYGLFFPQGIFSQV